ncbi:TspO/MBR family protein [Nubsella zeaxanthinifaciens]|uniref:TspO/MBR family protein n=1 Tax=Nubsella zeaxanthinifaciens TaxID=392412 RepID=UPI003D05D588
MVKKNPIPNAFAFLICIAIPIGIGFFASSFTIDAIKTWYVTLNKPSFNPPNWVFAPVWTTLYVLMGVASYRVWYRRKAADGFQYAVTVYFIQLALNFAWSLIFFEMRQIGLALIEIVLLLFAILFNGFIFYRFDKLAGWLFVPYFLWASFATYLTYTIFILN